MAADEPVTGDEVAFVPFPVPQPPYKRNRSGRPDDPAPDVVQPPYKHKATAKASGLIEFAPAAPNGQGNGGDPAGDEGPVVKTEAEVEAFKRGDLDAYAEAHGVSTDGTMPEVRARLAEAGKVAVNPEPAGDGEQG